MQPRTYVKKSSGKLPLKVTDFTHPKLALVPRRVTRLYRNTTTDWIRLRWFDGTAREGVTTPGHHFQDELGGFPTTPERARTGSATVVLASGELTQVPAERIVYSGETAQLFERAGACVDTGHGTAAQPVESESWKTKHDLYGFNPEKRVRGGSARVRRSLGSLCVQMGGARV